MLNLALCIALILVPLVPYLVATRRREAAARAAARAAGLRSEGPRAQHPLVDTDHCIGCGSCARACPEGDVLAIVAGKAAIVNGPKCIGHGLCAEACPVGALTIVMAPPGMQADMPRLSADYESSVPGLFVAGELGGLALIKNAVNQGREAVDTIAARRAARRYRAVPGVVDVCIVGAGPAGISAALRAIEKKLTYVLLEQDEFGGTVAKYPRRKLVMTSPVELPLFGRFRKLEVTREELLALWTRLATDVGLKVDDHEKVDDIVRGEDGVFTVMTTRAADRGAHRAHAVVLALGRRGTPRKLGVPGEERPKVMYSLIEADQYTDAHILVVGGGDSAIEAAMGLAQQRGNTVTLAYRKSSFTRIKERNARRIDECIRRKTLTVLFESQPVRIDDDSVTLEVNGEQRLLRNDYTWVFAGGVPPSEFLQRIGVATGIKDMSAAVQTELDAAAADRARAAFEPSIGAARDERAAALTGVS